MEDKKLQSLLKDFGMQETSAGFDEKLMQKIASIKPEFATSKPLISQTLEHIFIVIFFLVVLLLFLSIFFIQPGLFHKNFSIAISQKAFTQIFFFLFAFWIVMGLNIWWQKRTYNLNLF